MAYDVIRTHYHGPSGARGGRIRATWGSDSLTMDYPHEVSGQEERHAYVAAALVRKVGKRGTLRAGHDDKTGGYFFAFESSEKPHGAAYSSETGEAAADGARPAVWLAHWSNDGGEDCEAFATRELAIKAVLGWCEESGTPAAKSSLEGCEGLTLAQLRERLEAGDTLLFDGGDAWYSVGRYEVAGDPDGSDDDARAHDHRSWPVFEVTAAGFDGSSDETDDRVFWIRAESEEAVRAAIADTGATFWGKVEARAEFIADFTLTGPGVAMLLGARLLAFASADRNKSRAG